MAQDQYIAAALIVVGVGLVFWIVPKIRYEIDADSLRVMLGPLTMRRLALADIEFVDTQAPVFNEHWCNCFNCKGRIVRIRRKSGLVRNFIITPRDREALMEQLKRRL
jgi:hypothetical protein